MTAEEARARMCSGEAIAVRAEKQRLRSKAIDDELSAAYARIDAAALDEEYSVKVILQHQESAERLFLDGYAVAKNTYLPHWITISWNEEPVFRPWWGGIAEWVLRLLRR
jgi:hypothetical protein